MKEISIVNETLLAKWKWRFLHDRNAVWKSILEFRYGNLAREAFSHSSAKSLKMTSIWWRDLNLVGTKLSNCVDWFDNNIHCKLGRGNKMLFLWNKWCESFLCISDFRKCSRIHLYRSHRSVKWVSGLLG